MRFMDAIYIPQRLRDPGELTDVPRDKPGNRTNEVTHGWDRAADEHAQKKVRRWIKLRETKAYKATLK